MGTSERWGRNASGTPGFTLVELLMVIAIIGVLVALVLPAISEARETGRAIKCQSSARQLAVSSETYSTDSREWIVHGQLSPWPPSYARSSECPDWPTIAGSAPNNFATVLIRGGWVANDDLFTQRGCPYGPRRFQNNTGDPARAGFVGYPPATGLAINGVLQSGFGAGSLYNGPFRRNTRRLLRYSTDVMLTTCGPTTWDTGARLENFRRSLMHMLNSDPTTPEQVDPQYVRHRGRLLPMVFADGHGAQIQREEFLNGYADTSGRMYRSFERVYVFSGLDR